MNQVKNEIKKCKTTEELIKLAKKNGYNISKEKASELFNKTHGNKELSDSELKSVAGGQDCPVLANQCYDFIESTDEKSISYLFAVGTTVSVTMDYKTASQHKIDAERIAEYTNAYGVTYYHDEYYFDGLGWLLRNRIIKN